ncbi:hypothetical protein L7F22_025093 [Adiantum nelumboides]|nr:hypothetical protein [Adiantum nelumboides]
MIRPRASAAASNGNEPSHMFHQLSDNAVEVMQLAMKAAHRLGHGLLDCEHVLLGLLLLLVSDQHKDSLSENLSAVSQALERAYLHGNVHHLLQVIGRFLQHLYPNMRSPTSETADQSANPSRFVTVFTVRTLLLLQLSHQEAMKLGHGSAGIEHLLLGLLQVEQAEADQEFTPDHFLLRALGVNADSLREQLNIVPNIVLMSQKPESESDKPLDDSTRDNNEAQTGPVNITLDNQLALDLMDMQMLKTYCTDLTELAKQGSLDPVVGREAQSERLLQILGRRSKNNVCLVGEAGVGKTALAEALAQMIADGSAGHTFVDKRVMSLDVTRLLAGTQFRGELEQRLKKLMDEIQKCNRSIILFIDEIHTIVGAGGSTMDVANLLKPALARGELQCIGATTHKEYRKYMEKDPALERRFQLVNVPAPSVEETIRILRGLSTRYQNHHKVWYTEDALVAAAQLSDRYITDRFLPDKAIDLIDEAGSYVRMQALKSHKMRSSSLATSLENHCKVKVGGEMISCNPLSILCGPVNNERVVGAAHIKQIVAAWTGIPMEELSCEDSEKLLRMETELHRKIIGQEEAVTAVSRAVRRARVGLRDANRPIANFIFCGPTGVGKTQLAKALASCYFGSEYAMIRLDMSEFMERHSVSKLIGSPPGYVGYNETGQLTEAVRRRPFSIVLLDEIEKAHPDVFNLMLQMLEDGRLTDSKGKVVDFKNTLIIMTSNVGSSALLHFHAGGQSTIGFHAAIADSSRDDKQDKSSHGYSIVEEELKKCFKPEFLNRLDEIIVFNPLSQEDVREIARVMIEDVVQHLKETLKIKVQVSDRLRDEIVRQGFCPAYGARPLRRAITMLLEDGVAEHLLTGCLKEGDSAILDITKSPVTATNNQLCSEEAHHALIVNIL